MLGRQATSQEQIIKAILEKDGGSFDIDLGGIFANSEGGFKWPWEN
jgi:hypothetical protein